MILVLAAKGVWVVFLDNYLCLGMLWFVCFGQGMMSFQCSKEHHEFTFKQIGTSLI